MQTCVLVCGYHRSGTSMTMQALSKAGVRIGSDLLGPSLSNLDGHFEASEVVNFHEDRLVTLGTNWLSASLSNDDHEQFPATQLLIAQELVQSLGSKKSIWGFKDPRSTLFLPAWQKVIPNLLVVGVFRHYLHCIQSLRVRAARELSLNPCNEIQAQIWSDPAVCLRSWVIYNQQLLKFAKSNKSSCLVKSQESITNGFDLVSAINEVGGLKLNNVMDTGISPNLTNLKLTLPFSLLEEDQYLVEEADSIWRELCELSNEPALCSKYAAKHSIKRSLKPFEQLFDEIENIIGSDLPKVPCTTPAAHRVELPCFAELTKTDFYELRPKLKKFALVDESGCSSQIVANLQSGKNISYFGELATIELALILGDYQSAENGLSRLACYSDKDAFEAYFNGLINEKKEAYDAANKHYKMAIDMLPENYHFTIALVRTLSKLQEFELALEAVESALLVVGRNLQLEIKHIALLAELNRHKNANELNTRALERWPDNKFLLFSKFQLTSVLRMKEASKHYYYRHSYQRISKNRLFIENVRKLIDSIPIESDKYCLLEQIHENLSIFKFHTENKKIL